jgi:adenylate cyclase
MADESFKRKLAAILSADVEGYSRLMGNDEASTIHTLTAYKEVMTVHIKQNRGRVVDAPGDNLLAEFVSVVDAVHCAVNIQRELAKRNEELPEDRRMKFRIGVNLGDVVEEEGRLYGDGVNLAARLESMAEGGGVCISGAVYDQVKNKTDFGYEDLGEHLVKNFSEPIRMYKILCSSNISRALIKEIDESKQSLSLPDKPSIAVIPFENLTGDPKQEYVADGITESIITALSIISELFVIARNSVFTYKGKPVKVQQVSEELGIRYVLEGSVLKAGERIRITARLVDAITGHHLWAEKFDRTMGDFFDLLDEIAQRVAIALAKKLTHGESAAYGLGTINFEAWGCYVKAISYFERFTKLDNIKAREYLSQAAGADPEFAQAWLLLAWTYFIEVRFGFGESPDESLKKAFELGEKAASFNSKLPDVHSFWNTVHLIEGQNEKAIEEGKKAIDSGPSNALSYLLLSQALRFAGKFEEATAIGEQAIRLSPYCPVWYLLVLAPAYIETEKYQKALSILENAFVRSQKGEFPPSHVLPLLVITCIRLKRIEGAESYASELLNLNPNFSAELYTEALFYKNANFRERMVNDLIASGLK